MYKLVGPDGEVELTEGEMRRLMSVTFVWMMRNKQATGLTKAEIELTDKVKQFRDMHLGRAL